jgi:hypothetical protein
MDNDGRYTITGNWLWGRRVAGVSVNENEGKIAAHERDAS